MMRSLCRATASLWTIALLGGACTLDDSMQLPIAEEVLAIATVPSDSGIRLRTFILSQPPRAGQPIWLLHLLVNGQRTREVDSDPDLFYHVVVAADGTRPRPFSRRAVTRSSGELGMVTLGAGGIVGGVIDLACMSLPYFSQSSECEYGFRLEPGNYRLITTYERGPSEGRPVRPGFERLLLQDTVEFTVHR
jgi:hypothetical protein